MVFTTLRRFVFLVNSSLAWAMRPSSPPFCKLFDALNIKYDSFKCYYKSVYVLKSTDKIILYSMYVVLLCSDPFSHPTSIRVLPSSEMGFLLQVSGNRTLKACIRRL